MIQEKLKQLGFNEKEIEIYLKILELGKTTPSQIARETKINRTTVYAIAKNLIDNDIIAEDLGGKNLFLVALPIENLKQFTKKDEEKLNKKKKIIDDAILELNGMSITNKSYSVPKIRFVEEADMENYLYKNLSKWYESSKKYDGICWGFQDQSFAEKYKKWIEWAVEMFPENKVNLFSNRSQIEKSMNNKRLKKVRAIKFWKKDIDFSASTWVMGKFLIMLITSQKPNYLVEIHDEVMAHNMREVFKNIWIL